MKPEPVTANDVQPAGKPASAPLLPVVHMPVDARGLSLAILAAVAVVFALQWAQTFVVSLQLGTMQKMQNAATEVEKATQSASAPSVPRRPATHVVIDDPAFKLGDFLWTGSKGAASAMGQAVMVLFLAFFLLVAGDTFKRKM